MGKLNVVLCWHMHQPDYRYLGAYLRPWTWLHAIKDYSDMAAHLENIPLARAVVNFSPVLIEQLQDYPARIRACLDHAVPIRDEILDALAGQVPEGTEPHSPMSSVMPSLMRSLLRVNEAMMKSRFAAYARLHEETKQALAEGRLLPRQQLDDLLVWYVLAWLGESVRGEALPVALQEKAGGYTTADRHALLQLVGDVCGGLLPRYRALAEAGRVELSVTPFAHPILPLLQDMQCAHESMPHAPLPSAGYPGGTERCDWHLSEAVRVFRQAFGRTPAGCWPAEGGISEATLEQLLRHGFGWTASGARVLYNSLPEIVSGAHLHAWRLAAPGGEFVSPACFFRDDELSDRIGFEYSKWLAGDAVDDLVRRIEHSADSADTEEAVLSIIMDGENAWEYFPHNAAEFLTVLYERLGSHPRIRLTTFSAVLPRLAPMQLSRLVAGSWVHGTFSTWVGDPAKNRAWDLLINAKSAVDHALAPELAAATREGREPLPWVCAVLRQLAVCEASDWFWWLGEDNRLEDGPAFDLLYRQQLAGLYQLIGTPPPVALDAPVNSTGNSSHNSPSGMLTDHPPAMAGAMRSST